MIWRRDRQRADDEPDGDERPGGADDRGDVPGGGRGLDTTDAGGSDLGAGPEDPVTGGAADSAGPVVGEPGVPDDSVTDPAAQRRALIDLVIYAYDRTTSAGVRARLADGLRRVGVGAVEPDGEPFDASRHEAGGVEPTDDAALHDRIAETERTGFVDGDRVIRDPIVVVYRRR